jgi:membrane associated rhomboid family serine protease
MIPKARDRLPGLIMVVLAFLAGGYLARVLWGALARGFLPGKLGATHYAGSVQYIASIVGLVVGIVLFIALIVMGLRFAGLIGHDADET